MRIVFGGPPHSGKSVLMWHKKALKSLLPIGEYMPIRCWIDGEGDWAYKNADLAKQIRVKGNYGPEFTNWLSEAVRNSTARFSLVEIGGKITEENRQICKYADGFILVSSDPNTNKEWLNFAAEMNLKVLAIINSTLDPVQEWNKLNDNGVFEGLAVNLDRETYSGSKTIEHLIEFLLASVPEQQEQKPKVNTLTMSQIAALIGKSVETYTLPNGREVTGLNWKPEELPAIEAALKPFSTLGGSWLIDGPGPQWLVATIMHAMHPCNIVLSDSKVAGGQVAIGSRKAPVKDGSGDLNFSVESLSQGEIVRYSSENPIDAQNLPDLFPPTTKEAKPVFLNGRTSNWAVVEIVSTYMHAVPAVFIGQPVENGYQYVCAVSHSPNFKVGSVVMENDLVSAKTV